MGGRDYSSNERRDTESFIAGGGMQRACEDMQRLGHWPAGLAEALWAFATHI